jgi:PAS domain S-box-containing protein
MRKNLTNSGIDKNRVEEVPDQSEECLRLRLEKGLLTSQNMANIELSDIIDVKAIQPLMDDFYKLTHIPIGLNDLKGNVLAGVGWQDICTRFHRANPETCRHCVESNIKLSLGVVPGEFKLYRCKNNMWDIVTPIMVGDKHVGYVFAGQFFFEDEPLDYELFRSQARKYGFNEEEYMAALRKVPRLSREAVETGMGFFLTFANMLSQLSYSNIKLRQSLEERDALVDAVKESEKRYRMLFDHSTDAIILSDPRGGGKILSANPAACRMLGWKEEELVGKGRDVMFSLEDPTPKDVLNELTQSGSAKAQLVYRRKDGTRFPGEISTALFKDSNGEPRVVIIIRDITDRKKAEEALRLSNIYNRSLIEASLDPLVTIGPGGKITDVNNSTETVTGYSRDKLIGTDFSDYFTEPEKAKEAYQHVFQEGMVRDYPLEIQNKDGHITPVLYNASIYKDESGKVIGVFAAARDITELKKAEKALKRAHDTLEKLVKERTVQLEKAYKSLKENEKSLSEAQRMAHIGNWDWDVVNDKMYWSDELYHILGITPLKSLSYSDALITVHPKDRDYLATAIKEAFKGKPYDIDYRIILTNGEERIVHAQAEVIFDEKNIPVRMRGIAQDITERKKTEEAMEKIQETHIKEIHHRIKNNLQVISSLLSLEAEKFSDAKMLESFRESQNRVASMALIHEELYKGNELDTLDFSAYLQKLTADLFDSYNLRNGYINLKLDLEKINLDMDIAIPLGIIVNELVSNSLKHAFFAGKAGEICINLCKIPFIGKNRFHYMLTVEDNGKGIPEEVDFQNSESLGLQLVNILIEQIDGCIELIRNHGTKFTIRF